MEDKQAEPSEEIFTQVTTDLEEMNNIPKGTYSFYLNDHFMHAESGEGAKDNSLKRAFPDYIGQSMTTIESSPLFLPTFPLAYITKRLFLMTHLMHHKTL